jgi:hypothetical protein
MRLWFPAPRVYRLHPDRAGDQKSEWSSRTRTDAFLAVETRYIKIFRTNGCYGGGGGGGVGGGGTVQCMLCCDVVVSRQTIVNKTASSLIVFIQTVWNIDDQN